MTSQAYELQRRSVAGDRESLIALIDDCWRPIRSEIEKKIGATWRGLLDADDVMQVTYLEAFLRIRDFLPGGPNAFPAWLRRIALNNLQDGIRELQRDKRPPPARRVQGGSDESYVALAEDLACESLTPSRDACQRELRERIEALLRELPRDYSEVVRLVYLDGLTGPEAAARMNRSLGAVKMLLLRAKARLRDLLGSPSRFLGGPA